MFCEEVKDIAQISKVSLTRNDGVSDSSVYLIIVISYPGGKQNCTVLLEILGASNPVHKGEKGLIPRGGEMQNLVWVGDLQNKKIVGFMYKGRILKFISGSPFIERSFFGRSKHKLIKKGDKFTTTKSRNLNKSIKNKQIDKPKSKPQAQLQVQSP